MSRRDVQRMRLAVAQALLSANRPLVLAESPLLDEPAVAKLAAERYEESVLAEELALGDLVREAARRALTRLGKDPRLARERTVLEVVLAGGSVRSAAQALGVSREHLSNTSWKTVTLWVLQAFEELSAAARHKKPASDGRTQSRITVLS